MVTQKEFLHIMPNKPDLIIDLVYGNALEPEISELNVALAQLKNNIDIYGIANGILRFLSEDDPLIQAFYTKCLGPTGLPEYRYPYANSALKKKAEIAGFQEASGPIGMQTSKYHKETIAEHTKAVAAHYLSSIDIGKDAEKDRMDAMTALLHDVGKKWTAGTNQVGEMCFYGHDPISAYAAAKLFNAMAISRENAEPYIILICCHMDPKVKWTQKKDAEKDFLDKYGKDLHDKLVLLSKSDIGYQSSAMLEEDPLYLQADSILKTALCELKKMK